MQGNNGKINKIIVECHHAVGDVVMVFPALKRLREAFPETEIHMICGMEEQIPLIRQLGIIDHYYVLNVKTDSCKEVWKLCQKLRAEKYGLGIALGQSPRGLDVLLLKIGGCRRIISVFNAKAVYKRYIGVDIVHIAHRVEQHMACVNQAVQMYGAYKTCGRQMYGGFCTHTIIFPDIPRSRNTVGICVGTGSFFYRKCFKKVYFNAKEWPMECWMELAVRLAEAGRKIILFGGKPEEEHTAGYKDCIKRYGMVDLTGKCTLLESVQRLAACGTVVGADTGLMHAAAALDIRTVTLFGPTDPYVVGPYSGKAVYLRSGELCSPCYGGKRIAGCSSRRCMRSILVEEVFQAVLGEFPR